MTAEVDVHHDACESEVSKFNVGVIENGNGASSKDDGDGSYVFVTSGDGGTSDESDLANVHCSRVETDGGESELKLKGEVEESVVENPQSQLQEKAAAAEEWVHSGDPEIAVEVQSEEDRQLAKVEDLVQESELASQSDSKLDRQVKHKSNSLGCAVCAYMVSEMIGPDFSSNLSPFFFLYSCGNP